MSTAQILLYVILILLVFYALSKLFSGQQTLNKFRSTEEEKVVKAKDLATDSLNTQDFTYSIWIYIKDWNYNYGVKKYIFKREEDIASGETSSPRVNLYLGSVDNSLTIELATDTGNDPVECTVNNIPIQRWVNITFSMSTKALDVYINGKLIKTKAYTNLPLIPTNDIRLIKAENDGVEAGFEGYTSMFRYWPTAINPQESWNIYRKGPGGDFLGQMFNKYKFQFSFLKDDQAQFQFTT